MKTVIFISLSIFYLNYTSEAQVSTDKVVNEFLNSLPVSNDSIVDKKDSIDFISAFLYETDNKISNALRSFIKDTDVKAMLEEKLLVGREEVQILKSNNANQRIGLSRCRDGRLIILIPVRINKKISALSLIFVIYHEYAHHLLHTASDCNNNHVLTPQDELDADCLAADILEEKFKDKGNFIVAHATGMLYMMSRSSQGHYPSTKDRADLLIQADSCSR